LAQVYSAAFNVDLTGHAALVTGAANGVGKAVALALAASGAAVALNDINPDKIETVAEDIIAAGGLALPWHADVANRFQVGSMIEAARDAFGRVDILVNAAGVFKASPMATLDEWDWRRILDVNLTGAFFCTQMMGRVMADEGGGVIVNIASTAGHSGTLPQGISHVATKAGVLGLTRQSARELAPHGIRVNAICIGNLEAQADAPHNALNRAGTPEEIASVALFLCSDAARFLTGQAINVDGGEVMA
jgi:3-oxoacyl-[acyl-carrier protein] reductase